MRRTIRPLWVLFLIWLVASLACNLPVGNIPRQLSPREIARKTLEAQFKPTLDALPGGTPAPFENLRTATPPAAQPAPAGPTPVTENRPLPGQPYLYYAQSGDTLAAVAAHFGVEPDQITSPQELPAEGYLSPGQVLGIPYNLPAAAYPDALLPDSEIVYGPSAAGFDVQGYLDQAGGFLRTYSETVDNQKLSAAQIIQRIAVETSTNPRVLLAVLEHQSGWVYGQPSDPSRLDYPVGFMVSTYRGLWKELTLTARQLTLGYYGWRDGSLKELEFIGGEKVRISPQLNAGTAAVQYLYTRLLERKAWEAALYGAHSLGETYQRMFGDPWTMARQVEPLFPAGLAQPELRLPFAPGLRWSLTGGPHIAWGVGSPRSAIDFAPVTGEPACQVSSAWAQAAAPGVITRSERGQVALDLDGDGSEQTGWVIFYYHIAEKDRVLAGTRVNTDDKIGHPSCEGGKATGTHFHIARKYNGEWIPAGGPLPMNLGGWVVHTDPKPYEGTLVRGDQVVTAKPDGEHESVLERGQGE